MKKTTIVFLLWQLTLTNILHFATILAKVNCINRFTLRDTIDEVLKQTVIPPRNKRFPIWTSSTFFDRQSEYFPVSKDLHFLHTKMS